MASNHPQPGPNPRRAKQQDGAVRVRLRPARPTDIETLREIRHLSLRSLEATGLSPQQLERSARATSGRTLAERQREGCVLLAERRGHTVAYAAMDPDEATLIGPFVLPELQGRGIGRRMVVGAERLAASLLLFRLGTRVLRPALPFFKTMGYAPFEGSGETPEHSSGLPGQLLRRHFPRRQTAYGRRVLALGQALGVPRDYARSHRLPLQEEARRLQSVGPDRYGREQQLLPGAAAAWESMHERAQHEGITLQLVSAYRSLDYQAGLLRRKLDRGQSMAQILQASAAPGFSEHHSGRALDLSTPGAPVLEEAFEQTDAFAWLSRHAADHGFTLSYPRDNPHGVIYEPWHWAWNWT